MPEFKYSDRQPYSEAELTMRGDSPTEEAEHSPQLGEPGTNFEADAIAGTTEPWQPASRFGRASVHLRRRACRASASAGADSRRSRRGLDRSRFLDFNDPAVDRPRSGTSTVVGPSFLGLGDPPAAPAEYAQETVEPAGSHWLVWFALAVVVVVAGLGLMEWRAQMAQSNTGPLEIIKAEINQLRHGRSAEATSAATSPSPNPSDTPNPTGSRHRREAPSHSPDSTSANAANSSATGTPANSTAPAVTTAVNGSTSTPSAVLQTAKPPAEAAPSATLQTGSAKPAATPKPSTPTLDADARAAKRPATQDSDASDEVVTRKTAPGVEEMTKAANASDATATAAWLWKATAKGNPDAPIRLADMYIKGDGVPRSCDQAVVLLKSAAAKQNARARNRLASMYATGNCVPRDRVQAYRWLSSALAADPNSEWAQQNRALIWRQMTAEEKAQAAQAQ